MWKEFMNTALEGIPAQDFPKPRGLVRAKVNWDNGKLASEYSPKERVSSELFWLGKEPKEFDTGEIEWNDDESAQSIESFFQ